MAACCAATRPACGGTMAPRSCARYCCLRVERIRIVCTDLISGSDRSESERLLVQQERVAPVDDSVGCDDRDAVLIGVRRSVDWREAEKADAGLDEPSHS